MAKLSLCAIVKDEAALLPRMLESVRGLVDEIVVADTGSTDGTREVARRFDAIVVEHPFRDDFSAARNAALDAATGDWILVLDADEVLVRGHDAVRRAIASDRHAGYYLNFRNHLGGGRVHACGLMRLFRNHASIRFRHRIHEQVIESLADHCARTGTRLAPLDAAVVDHDGYLPERAAAKDKAARNLRLFRLQIESAPDHAYSWYKFGDFLRSQEGKGDEARAALEKAAELVRGTDPAKARDLSFPAEIFALLAVDADNRGDAERALAWATEGLERFGATPNLMFVLGHLRTKRGEAREALRCYVRLRRYDGELLAVPPEPGITGAFACFGIARALAMLGRPRRALRFVEESLRLDPRPADPRILCARLLLAADDAAGAEAQYRAALEHSPRHAAARLRLGTLLLHCDRFAEAAIEIDQALEHGAPPRVAWPKLGEALLLAGELESAYLAYLNAREAPESQRGLRLLEQLAAGNDPATDPLFASDAGRRFLQRFALRGPLAQSASG